MFNLIAMAVAGTRIATVHLGVGLPDLMGGSVSLTAFRPLEVEVGAANGILYTTVFARAGAALPLYDRREEGRGLLIEGLALGGWRWLRNTYWTGDNSRNGVELNLAAELSYWFKPHLALDVQLLAGGGLWVETPVAAFMDGRFTIGLAF
jgi:hypothetical protein